MNTENGKENGPHIFIFSLADKLNLEDPSKNMALAKLSIYYTWKNIKPGYNNNKFKISDSTWNDEFHLSDGAYSISDIQDYSEHNAKKPETIPNNRPVQLYVNKIKNRTVFKIKTGHK